MVNVFGGTGFVGSYYANKFPCIINDRTDFVPKTDTVLYLISTTDNYNIHTNPTLDIETNLTVLMKVLGNCKNKDITFNFSSSWYVYGDSLCPAYENSHCNPKGFYSITKRTAELLLIEYCQTFNIKYRILRFGNILGRGDKNSSAKKNVLTYLINELKQDRPITLYNNGDFYRDYIHIDDLCSAVNLIIKQGETNTIYNVGNGIPVLFADAINYAANKLGKSANINLVNDTNSDIIKPVSLYLNCDKIYSLGYEPKYTWKNTIDELLA